MKFSQYVRAALDEAKKHPLIESCEKFKVRAFLFPLFFHSLNFSSDSLHLIFEECLCDREGAL